MTDDRTVYCGIIETVYPGIKYPVAPGLIGINVIVALHIVHYKEVGCRKAPQAACPGTVGMCFIDLIDSPVVRSKPLELTGIITFRVKLPGAFVLR